MTRSTALRMLAVFLSLLLIPLIIYSCKPDSTITSASTGLSGGGSGTTAQKSTITGQAINSVSGVPMDSVLVRITGSTFDKSLLTDSQGKYTTDFSLTSNVNFTIIATRSGYVGDTTSVTLTPGGNIAASVLSLAPVGGSTKPSGNPVSIYLFSQTVTTIGVKGSGAPEIANLVFQVVDSSGTAIDLSHSVNVKFEIAASPGGGEVISPAVVQTNNLGQATVNVTSGTKAGVMQFIARVDLPNNTLKSTPVSITIHGGLPDLNHFSIIPSQVNFPGYDPALFGNTMNMSVVVGDKYSNPVKPGTSVYFNTTGGTIEGGIQTDNLGKGSVTLTSGNPTPDDSALGKGFARITASTVDENAQTINRQSVILFSGLPKITFTPGLIDIPNGGSQNFSYIVADENGNPLAGGTNITVTVDGQNVAAAGETNVFLPDTQDSTWTHFSFSVYDVVDTVNSPAPISITINTSGPNGSAKLGPFTGTSH